MALVVLFMMCSPLVIVWEVVFFPMFLLTLYRTAGLIRTEHRRLTPGWVWFCMIPVAGVILAIWVVDELAASLRNQFLAAGDHRPDDTYGLTEGRVWTVALLVIDLLVFAAGAFDQSFISALLILLLFPVAGVSWMVYWAKIEECERRLRERFKTPVYSPEESDYADDLPPGDE